MKVCAAVRMYVLHRRTVGQKLEGPALTLQAFCVRYGDVTLEAITAAEVKHFLDVPHTGPATWRRKYGVLRDFFKYWQCREQLSSVPMPREVPKYKPTFVPYIYSRSELRLLLGAVPRCQQRATCSASAETLRTLLLFLYGTGMRAGEALRLRVADLNLESAVITVHNTKFYKSRLVPLGQDVVTLLRRYLDTSGRRNAQNSPLFESKDHRHLGHSPIDARFRRLCALAGVRRKGSSARSPRLHDLRHTFAVHRLTEWYRAGADVQVLLPALSTYLGHVDLHSTQCYLTMTPELLAQASQRFQHYVYGGQHGQ